ncbi:hypothetical protein [Methylotenera sp.]|uniref:hypothetical protein n=1 Tax=Methylotenera sp. TaxID=2051956 RepID=UPI0027311F00|nr:hypothetical protein [Methylotenera sp.]MDP2229363.1 hypothetical protein [Methylotenera sp.]
MHNHLVKRQSRLRKERTINNHGHYRRERIRYQDIACSTKPMVDYNHKWNEDIIWARLVNSINRINFRVATILKTKQMFGLKSIFSGVYDIEECNTIYVISDASNDASYTKASTKEVLYVHA